LSCSLKVVAAFEKLAAGLEDLIELAEDFKSSGIPGLLRKTPALKELLENVQSIYDGDELLPVDGADEAYEVCFSCHDFEKRS
jgi:DNA mismatch repair protein MSH6